MIILREGDKIIGTVNCDPDWYHILETPYIECLDKTQDDFDINAYYIVNEEITEKPVMSVVSAGQVIANGTDIGTITGIPAGAEITSNGTTMTVDGDPIEFVTDIPGEHRLSITLWPYQDEEVIINAI